MVLLFRTVIYLKALTCPNNINIFFEGKSMCHFKELIKQSSFNK